MISLPTRAVLALASIAPLTAAQAIYVDCSSSSATLPSSSYGAAQDIPGQWNRLRVGVPLALVDRAGHPTSATATVPANGTIETSTSVSGVTLDEAALLQSTFENAIGRIEIHLDGLDAGDYQVVLISTYRHETAPGSFQFLSSVDGSPTGTFSYGDIPTQPYAYGFAYRLLHVPLGGSARVDVAATLAGFLLVRLADATPFCSGNLNDCPCASGAGGAGCPSSFSSAGASLAGSGSHSVSSDTFTLVATNVSTSAVLLFQGDGVAGSGRGVQFGDGLRCIGGTLVRLGRAANANGVVRFPAPGAPPLSVAGGVGANGGFRAYQVWYRNPAPFCTASTSNSTNGVAVQWNP